MSTEITPSRLMTADEVQQLRGLIKDRGEKPTARLLGISTLTQTRALSGLTMEATTVQRMRQVLAGLRAESEVAQ